MKLFTTKNFKIEKTQFMLKQNNLLFFFNGTNQKSDDWVIAEQKLKKINFSYYKIINKASKIILNNSLFLRTNSILNSNTCLLKLILKKKEIKKKLLNSIELLLFSLLTIKLNKNFYLKDHLKKLFSLNYTDNKLLCYKFLIINLKIFYMILINKFYNIYLNRNNVI